MSKEEHTPLQKKFIRVVTDHIEKVEPETYQDPELDNLTSRDAEYKLTASDAGVLANFVMFREIVQAPSEELGTTEEERSYGIEMYGGVLDNDFSVININMDASDGRFTQILPDQARMPTIRDESAVKKILDQIVNWDQEGKLRPASPEGEA